MYKRQVLRCKFLHEKLKLADFGRLFCLFRHALYRALRPVMAVAFSLQVSVTVLSILFG